MLVKMIFEDHYSSTYYLLCNSHVPGIILIKRNIIENRDIHVFNLPEASGVVRAII